MPQVSVAMSTYNRADLLPFAIRSVLRQRDVDLELVVVDNASTDGTARLLAEIDDPRIRVVSNTANQGSLGGRNRALAAVRGDWVAIHDDDDVWAPDKLRSQLDAMALDGRSWCAVGCVYIDGEGRVLGGRPPLDPGELMAELPLRYAVRGGISNVVWRRDALDGDGLLDERLTMTADWDLALRLSRTGPPAVVRRPLLACRQHGSNLSRRAGEFQQEFELLEEKFDDLLAGREVDRGEQWRFVASEALRSGARADAARAYVRGVLQGDTGCLLRAPAVLAPRAAQLWLRRRVLSDETWVEQATGWLSELLDARAPTT